MTPNFQDELRSKLINIWIKKFVKLFVCVNLYMNQVSFLLILRKCLDDVLEMESHLVLDVKLAQKCSQIAPKTFWRNRNKLVIIFITLAIAIYTQSLSSIIHCNCNLIRGQFITCIFSLRCIFVKENVQINQSFLLTISTAFFKKISGFFH